MSISESLAKKPPGFLEWLRHPAAAGASGSLARRRRYQLVLSIEEEQGFWLHHSVSICLKGGIML